MKNHISALSLSMFMTVNLVFALPYGIPVYGKQGYVTSPYAEYEGYVDVRNFPTGTEVKCPYSGKIFLVPSQVAAEGSNSEEADPAEVEKIKVMLQELKEMIQAARSENHNQESCDEEQNNNDPPPRVQTIRNPVRNSESIYDQIERVQAISNPNERAAANRDFFRGIMGVLGESVEGNPQAFGGMSSDEFMMESLYNKAREEGLPPSEAQIEAQRQYQNMKRFME